MHDKQWSGQDPQKLEELKYPLIHVYTIDVLMHVAALGTLHA